MTDTSTTSQEQYNNILLSKYNELLQHKNNVQQHNTYKVQMIKHLHKQFYSDDNDHQQNKFNNNDHVLEKHKPDIVPLVDYGNQQHNSNDNVT